MPSTLTICYLFLGGAGAGAAFVLIVLDLLSPQAARPAEKGRAAFSRDSSSRFVPQAVYRRLFAPGFLVSLGALVLGMLCLLFDLGRADRFFYLFTHPTLSYLTLGSFSLLTLALCVGFLVLVWGLVLPPILRWIVRTIEIFGLVNAFIVMLYTGLLFYQIGTGILLDTLALPLLFVLSSLSTGIALLLAMGFFTDAGRLFETMLQRLARLDIVLIVGELLFLILLLSLAAQNQGLVEAVASLITGTFALIFWAGVVICGLLVPLALESVLQSNRKLMDLAAPIAACVLIGGYCLRFSILSAGLPVFSATLTMVGN